MNIFLALAIVLLAAKLGGFLAKRIGQPAMLGEILAGVIIGPSLLNIYYPSTFFHYIAEVGIIFLIFLVGLELDLETLEKFLKSGTAVAVFGAFFPFIATIFLGPFFLGLTGLESLFLATIFMTTSVSISASALKELGKLKSNIGVTIVDAAVISDILGVVMLTLLLGVIGVNEVSAFEFGMIGSKILLFFAVIVVLGPFISRFIMRAGERLDLRVKEGHLSLILILIFLLAYAADMVGLSLVTGAFLAGVIFNKAKVKRIEHEIYSMTYGLFVPIFFILVGTYINLDMILPNLYWIFMLTGVALAAKFAGAAFGAGLTGHTARESGIIGVGMLPRCEVALILALIGRSVGLISASIYSIVVTSIILMVLISLPLFKLLLSD